jgi:hypothetical protein
MTMMTFICSCRNNNPPAPTRPGFKASPLISRPKTSPTHRTRHRCQASVAQQFETGPSWGGGVVYCITIAPHRKSVSRRPASDAIYPTKSQPFSIIWQDNTESVVDLHRLLQHEQNFELCLYKPSTSILLTSNGARAPSAVAGPRTVLLLYV